MLNNTPMTPLERLDSELARRRITWDSLAKALGTSNQNVSNWTKKGVPVKHYRKIAEFIGKSLDWLEFGTYDTITTPATSSAIATTPSQPVDREPNIPRFTAGRMGSESRVKTLLSLLAEDLQHVDPAQRDATGALLLALAKNPSSTQLVTALEALMEPVDVDARELGVTKKKAYA